jgi:hypothetical protein
VYGAAGGSDAPELQRESLALPRRESEPLEHDVLRCGVEMFCLGETVAVRLFTRLRAGCTVKVARRALDRILCDEVGHRDFGWALLFPACSAVCAATMVACSGPRRGVARGCVT